MKWPYPSWFLGVALLALAPVGLRVLLWHTPQPVEVMPDMAQAGKVLFTHEWQPNDPLSPGGDGLGPVFNANSCAACHHQGGLGGGGDLKHNVTIFVIESRDRKQKLLEGVIHSQAVSEIFRETQRSILGGVSEDRTRLSKRNTPALFGAKWIDEIPDRVIIANERRQRLQYGMSPTNSETVPVGRASRLPNGRVGKFGWKAQTASLADFVQAACANELGLGNPGHPQPQPLSVQGYQPVGLDLTQAQCNQLTAFVAALPRPIESQALNADERSQATEGKALFMKIGCANCHTPNLGSVEGLYSDLLLHRMGQQLEGEGSSYGGPPRMPDVPVSPSEEGPLPDEWRTPPLWGVADSAPYLHDGRAPTLEEAILSHGGQGAQSATRFGSLPPLEQGKLLTFLRTLRVS